MLASILVLASILRAVAQAVNLPSVSSIAACSCSSGYMEVEVDVEVAADPSDNRFLNATTLRHVEIAVDPSDGKFLNSTTLRRQITSFQIFGQLCQLVSGPLNAEISVACSRSNLYVPILERTIERIPKLFVHISSIRVLKEYPLLLMTLFVPGKVHSHLSSEECQIPTAAAVTSSLAQKLKDGSLVTKLTGATHRFLKGRPNIPILGPILTGSGHDPESFTGTVTNGSTPAQGIDPARWGNLDPGYVSSATIQARSVFNGPTGSFDPDILQLDLLTKDVGSRWISSQVRNIYSPANFSGPVTEIIGELDKTHCLDNNNTPCEEATLQVSEKFYFPKAEFNVVVIPGQGHDLNLEFDAVGVFPMILNLFKKATK
ncbi:hypothetical protein M422DRAFT_249206 [Sphaerobolus stellatus SS14]|nr:hypothetical protein M422DRAFT_249206 [Sphaerobolus stellatus SS14]